MVFLGLDPSRGHKMPEKNCRKMVIASISRSGQSVESQLASENGI
jgi:hypothetical protein